MYSRVMAVIALLHICLSPWAVGWGGEQGKEFRAGAATSNITPWLGVSLNGGMTDRRAAQIHDDLHARCLVLDDGQTRLAIAVCDSCMIPREVVEEARRLVLEHAGLPVNHVLISATHAHSAATCTPVFQSDPDPGYPEFLARRIADGIRRAIHQLEPARIGWAVGNEPTQVFNRRWRMKPGTIPPDPFGRTTDLVKMNPGVGNENLIEPAGPIDPEVPIISVQSRDGRPIALLANYSLHYVGGTKSGDVSADYFAMFANRMQQLIGADHLDPPFVGIMSNGTSGDINNVNFRGGQERQPPYGQMRLVADTVAREAYRVYQTIQYQNWVPLGVRESNLKLGVRKPDAADLQRAEEILAKAKSSVLTGQDQVYARESVKLAEYPDQVEMILQTMRIGDLAITAIPCEVFVEIGLELKAKSPFQPTFTIELANGYNGYLPTPEQHQWGGYETWRARSSYLEVGASPKITAILLEQLRELKGK